MMSKKYPRPTANPKRRVCLRCDREFLSTWEGERICLRCSKVNEKVGGIRVVPVVTSKGRGKADADKA